MADIVLNDITSGYNVSRINANFTKIEESLNGEVLKRTGGGNTMFQDLDMNGNRFLNAIISIGGVPTQPNDAVRLQDLANEAGVRQNADAALSAQITNILANQQSGLIGYPTLAALNADLSRADGTVAVVTNDPTPANNTTYRKNGAAGTGSWVLSFDRITQLSTSLAASSGSSTVGFLQSGVNAQNRTVQSKLRERVSPEDFGGVGDGVTDDTVAIQRAIDAASAAGGGKEVYLPNLYKVSSTLSINTAGITFRGKNWQSTTITCSNASIKILNVTGANFTFDNIAIGYSGVTPTTTAATAIAITGSNPSLTNFVVFNSGVGVSLSNAFVAHLMNFQILTFSQAGLFFNNWVDAYFSNFVLQASVGAQYGQLGCIYANNTQAISASNADILSGQHAINMTGSAYCLFTNIYCDSTISDACFLSTSSFNMFANCWFSGGRFVTNGSGVSLVSGSFASFTNCVMYNNGGHGAFVAAAFTGATFDSCQVNSNCVTGTAGTYHGIAIDAGCSDFIIKGCIIRNTIPAGQQGAGIFINGGASDRFIITNNILTGNLTNTIVMSNVSGTNYVADDSNIGWKKPYILITSFANSWVNFGSILTPVGYIKDSNGFVHIQGTLKSGTIGQAAFTLPVGYRPTASCSFPVIANGLFGWINIDANGVVVMSNGSNVSMGLDGISFKAA